MPAKFGVGDEVSLRGTVRLVDVAGEGMVTIELQSTGHRVTVMSNSTGVELVEKAKGSKAFTRGLK